MLGKYIRFVTLITLLSTSVWAEPSLYGFGIEEGTAQTEPKRAPLTTMAAMRQRIAEQDERIDGLTTIIEGLSASLNEMRSNTASNNSNTTQNSDAVLQKLVGMIDEINANYVRRDELNRVLAKGNTKSTPKNKAKTDSLSGKSNATLYSEGVRHFIKKRYSEAKKRFTITDTKGYKPAASNYYLGEIAYYTKQYEDAIFYFKKSTGLYDKASYIATLLLHTAISLEKIGEKKQAKIFYKNIIENYVGKKTAQIASDRVKKL